MGENHWVAGKGAQQRRKQRKRTASWAVARPLERPDRFQRTSGRRISRRTLFIAVLILLAVALVIPAFVGVGLVGRSVPSPTQQPGGGARLVPNEPSNPVNWDNRVITRPPE